MTAAESSHPEGSDSTRRNAAGGKPTDAAEVPDSARILASGLAGRYRLVRTLGKGGFANVYLAHDSVLDQDVAIKILKLGLASKADQDRFLFEARVGAKLRHPNIANVFDIVQTSEGLQMIMEYYPAGTLGERLKAGGALKPRQATDVARQVAQALSHAHRHSIVHRDVKPANIFFSHDGMVKLGDFGIAANSELHEFTQTGMIIGTPLYMAPEQSTDSRDVDPRADLYALGLTLYHMLTGRPPRVLELEKIPEAFRRLISVATDHDRTKRVVSAQQFIAMLDQIDALPRTAAVTLARDEVLYPETRIETRETEGATPGGESSANSASTTRTDASQPPPFYPDLQSSTNTGIDTAALASTITAQHTTNSRIWMMIAVAALIVMAGMGAAMFYSVWNLRQNSIVAIQPTDAPTSPTMVLGQGGGNADVAPEATASPTPSPTPTPTVTVTPVIAVQPISATPVPPREVAVAPIAATPDASQTPRVRSGGPEAPKTFGEVLMRPRPDVPREIQTATRLIFEPGTTRLKSIEKPSDRITYDSALAGLESMISAPGRRPMALETFLLSFVYLRLERLDEASKAFAIAWSLNLATATAAQPGQGGPGNQRPRGPLRLPITRGELERDFNLTAQEVGLLFKSVPAATVQ